VPYLVRAVYGHGGTGAYDVLVSGKSIIIIRGSLGKSVEYNKFALVVCLENKPENLFVSVSIAE